MPCSQDDVISKDYKKCKKFFKMKAISCSNIYGICLSKEFSFRRIFKTNAVSIKVGWYSKCRKKSLSLAEIKFWFVELNWCVLDFRFCQFMLKRHSVEAAVWMPHIHGLSCRFILADLCFLWYTTWLFYQSPSGDSKISHGSVFT